MSRIGKMPIKIEKGVEINIFPDNKVVVKGPLGVLERTFDRRIKNIQENDRIRVIRKGDSKEETMNLPEGVEVLATALEDIISVFRSSFHPLFLPFIPFIPPFTEKTLLVIIGFIILQSKKENWRCYGR